MASASRAAEQRPAPGAVARVRRLYGTLLGHYGPQQWWPADDAFEMMVGAVLVQNTAWRNVEPAIGALRDAGLLEWRRLARASESRIAAAIRCCGTFRVKARRLSALARYVAAHGGPDGLAALDSARMRRGLLAVHGVGEETADAILVYGFARPSFVLDTYARRLCVRLGLHAPSGTDAALRSLFEAALPHDAAVLGECHALVVAHAKAHCRASPSCDACPLRRSCRYRAAELR